MARQKNDFQSGSDEELGHLTSGKAEAVQSRAHDSRTSDSNQSPSGLQGQTKGISSQDQSIEALGWIASSVKTLPQGSISVDDGVGWYIGTSYLQVSMSGLINSDAVDDINNLEWNPLFVTVYARVEAWKSINDALNTSYDINTSLWFLPAISHTDTTFTGDTQVVVPVLIAAQVDSGKNPQITINAGAGHTVELSGQVIYGAGFIDVNINSGQFIIDRALTVTGDFYIADGASYYFGGLAPDTTAIDGVSVSDNSVLYNNGNTAGKTFWAQVLNGSTIYMRGGSASTSAKGVIVVNDQARIEINDDSTVSGNIVVGWDHNTVVFGANLTLAAGAKLVVAAKVDLGSYSVSGPGQAVISGDYYNGTDFVASEFSIDGGTLGNLALGYNPFYNDGLGGDSNAFGQTGLTNPHPVYGVVAYINGSISLSGTLSLGGGGGASSTLEINTNVTITSASSSCNIELVSGDCTLSLLSNVTIDCPITNNGGLIDFSTSDIVQTLIVNSGTINFDSATSASNQLQIGNLTQTGGQMSGGWLDVTGTTSLSGGTFNVTEFSTSGDLEISGTAVVTINGGKATDISVASSGSVYLAMTFSQLTLEAGDTGTTTVNQVDISSITANGGTLKFYTLTVSVTDLVVGGGGNVSASTDTVSVTNLSMTGGQANFKSLTVATSVTISGGTLTVSAVTITTPVLTISGSGGVDFASGTLGTVTIDSSGSSTIGATYTSLQLSKGNSGVTTLTQGDLATIDVAGGTLDISCAASGKTLTIEGGKVEVKDKDNDDLSFGDVSVSGGSLNVASLSVSGSFAISGGSVSASTIDYTASTLVISGSGAAKLLAGTLADVKIDSSGDNTIGASFTSLTLSSTDTGKTILTSASFSIVTVDGGKLEFSVSSSSVQSLTLGKGTITGLKKLIADNLSIGGSQLTLTDLTVKNTFSVSGGQLSVNDITAATTMSVTGSGTVDISSGSISTVTYDSIADSSLGVNIESLTMKAGDTGSLTLTGGTIGVATLHSGAIDVTGTVTIADGLVLNGGAIDITGTLLLKGSNFSAAKGSTITLDGGVFEIDGLKSVELGADFVVGPKGGSLKIDDGATITLNSKAHLDGPLTLEGSGTVVVSSSLKVATGLHAALIVSSRVTLVINDNLAVDPDLVLNAGGVIKIASGSGTEHLANLTINGGKLTAGETVDADAVAIAGGTSSFTTLSIAKSLDVSGGALDVKDISFADGTVQITGSGAIDFKSGSLGTVTYASSADSTLDVNVKSLTMAAGCNGMLTLEGGDITALKQQAGTVDVAARVTMGAVDLTGGTLDVTGVLTLDGATFTFASKAYMDVDGGTINFEQDGTYTFGGYLTIGSSGGTLAVKDSGVSLDLTGGMSLDGTLTLQGGGAISIGGEVTASSTKAAIDLEGVTLIVLSAANIAPVINVGAGSVVDFDAGADCTATVVISDAAAKHGCTLRFADGFASSDTTHIGVKIENFCNNVSLDLTGLSYKGCRVEKAYYSGGKIYIIFDEQTKDGLGVVEHEIVFDNVSGSGLYDGEVLTVSSDGSGGTDIETCYLAGTPILTLSGWKNVEDLVPGESVVTLHAGETSEACIEWVGMGEARCRSGEPDDLAGYPVRISRDAFGPNMPFKDILVTSEHCLYVDGYLVPARMLVNGGSISYERGLGRYRFYHFATGHHAIVNAGGIGGETYLDTGNRKRFKTGRGVVQLTPPQEMALAAPLVDDRETAKAIHQRLSELEVCQRLLATKPLTERFAPELEEDANFCVVLPDGHAFYPQGRSGDYWVFNIPESARRVSLVSRSSRPCDVHGPYDDDRRELGILVGKILVVSACEIVEVDGHLTCDETGWHNVEHGDVRWTDGCATLHLTGGVRRLAATCVQLRIQVLQAGPYVVRDGLGKSIRSLASA